MKRNRWIVWLAMSFFAVMPMMAQLGEVRNNLSVGINGGLNMSKVDFSPSIKQKSKNGMSMGITARYISEKYFNMLCGIQMELNYSQRGWNENIEDGTENTYNRTMNYKEVPLLAHLAFGKDALDRGVRFFLNLGPQFGLFLNEKENMSENWNPAYRPNGVIQQYGKMVSMEKCVEKYAALLKVIMDYLRAGKHPNLKIRENGLLYSEGKDTPITWMNSTANGRPIVPRSGYIVEFNALWYNALKFAEEICATGAWKKDKADTYAEQALKVESSFKNIFLNEHGYLFDYVDEFFKQEPSVGRPPVCLGMELCCEDRF